MIVIAIFCMITILNLSEAKNIDVFEISANKLTNDISIKPVKLHYDIESRESNRKELNNRHINKVNDITDEMLKRLKKLKAKAREEAKEPIILILTDNGNIVNEILKNTADNEDYTRTKGSSALNEFYRLIQENQVKRLEQPFLLRSDLRFPIGVIPMDDRTAAPRHRYFYDRKERK